ncbi:hypothetical protein [Actinomadura sp. 6N118]|uniref:hypothetical protein n=1 Tax=Actinomadura sp. 6N118 TaxID=3375151 RepID=UPI0037A2B0A3
MTDEITLPDADELWAEAAALAVLPALIPGMEPMGFGLVSGGLRSGDVGNGWWGMSWVEGGRAVVYGYDNDGSQTRAQVLPIDLLAGGPGWLPWEWLHKTIRHAEILAFVYWWDGESWARTPYPEGMNDGAGCGSGGADDRYWELAEEYSDAVAAYNALVNACRARTVDRAVIEALISPLDAETVAEELDVDDAEGIFDIDGALAVAEEIGVRPGSDRPELPAGNGEPPGRRVFVIEPAQARSIVGAAMSAAREAERPAPAAGDALNDVVEWMRANGHEEIRAAFIGHPRHPFALRHANDTEWLDEKFSELLNAWREEEGDDRLGRWLYVRVHAPLDAVNVERAYDHRPAFWKGFYVHEPLDRLREEMARRDAAWRPGWASMLDVDYFKDGAPPDLCWRPGTAR